MLLVNTGTSRSIDGRRRQCPAVNGIGRQYRMSQGTEAKNKNEVLTVSSSVISPAELNHRTGSQYPAHFRGIEIAITLHYIHVEHSGSKQNSKSTDARGPVLLSPPFTLPLRLSNETKHFLLPRYKVVRVGMDSCCHWPSRWFHIL